MNRLDDISPQREDDAKSSPLPVRSGRYGHRPWRGWWATGGIQPPRAGCRPVKASQAFTPSLSKEGSSLGASLTYVALRSCWERFGQIAFLMLLISCRPVLAQPNFEITPDIDELLRSGLSTLYNYDLIGANKKFAELIRRFPQHPIGYVYRAEVIWWEALQDRNNPGLQESFRDDTEAAISRGEAILKKNPRDFYALLYVAAAYGNKTRFQGGVRKAYMNALQSGLKGHAYIKEASSIRPENIDCLIGTGAYNYFAGALPLVVKPFAWMFGARGDKNEGIKQLQLASQKGEYGQTEAKTVLLPVYFNEGRFDDYQTTLTHLIDQYPSNPVFYMWMAGFFISQKKANEGVQFFAELIKRGDNSPAARVDLSAAQYERGRLEMEGKNWDGAISSLTQVIEACPTDKKLLVQAHLLRGFALDLNGRRSGAVLSYQAVLTLPDFENSHGKARRYLKAPYRGVS
jgi:Tetratricopeptide repeat